MKDVFNEGDEAEKKGGGGVVFNEGILWVRWWAMNDAWRADLNTKMCAHDSLCIAIVKTKLPPHNFWLNFQRSNEMY